MPLPIEHLVRHGIRVEGLPPAAEVLGRRGVFPNGALAETRLSCALARELDTLSLTGRLKGVWSATEIRHAARGKRGMLTQARLRSAGVNTGWADYTFLWDRGSGLLELKSRTGELRPAQIAMRSWCQAQNVHYGVARSVQEALDHLKAWGALV